MRKFLTITLLMGVLIALAGWLGLPAMLTAMGLHPDYAGERIPFRGRALIVTTSHDRLGDEGATGVFASEMTAPYYEFRDAGMDVDLASIKGGQIPIDPISFRWFVKSKYDHRYLNDVEFQGKARQSLGIDSVDFRQYDIVFLAGGWGAAYDFAESRVLGRKISEAYAVGSIVGGVCHGPLGLLLAEDEQGRPLVRNRRVTAVTNKQVAELGITMTPQHPERELMEAGALFEAEKAFRDVFANHVVVDGRLVTGQNQNAGPEVAVTMMKLAREHVQ